MFLEQNSIKTIHPQLTLVYNCGYTSMWCDFGYITPGASTVAEFKTELLRNFPDFRTSQTERKVNAFLCLHTSFPTLTTTYTTS